MNYYAVVFFKKSNGIIRPQLAHVAMMIEKAKSLTVAGFGYSEKKEALDKSSLNLAEVHVFILEYQVMADGSILLHGIHEEQRSTAYYYLRPVAVDKSYFVAAAEACMEFQFPRTKIVSKPSRANVLGGDEQNHFVFFETIGLRKEQEDALAWQSFIHDELNGVSAQHIGYCLWTTYQNLDEQFLQTKKPSGTTAITVVIKEQNIITSSVGDALAVIVFYDHEGRLLDLKQLNRCLHTTDNTDEASRVRTQGGKILLGRVGGALSLTRAIGDIRYKEKGVCSEAEISVLTVSSILKELNIPFNNVGTIQILVGCDGWVEAVKGGTILEQEFYLKSCLNSLNWGHPASLKDSVLVEELGKKALADGSEDNISIAVQTLFHKGKWFSFQGMFGIYDGHGGKDAAHFVSEHIGDEFLRQIGLFSHDYDSQANSVFSKSLNYQRDNGEDVSSYYKFQIALSDSDAGRVHRYPVRTPYASGDALKTSILQEFYGQLRCTENEKDLDTTVAYHKKTVEYQVLKRGQDSWTRFFPFATSSIKAYKKMSQEAQKDLKENEIEFLYGSRRPS